MSNTDQNQQQPPRKRFSRATGRKPIPIFLKFPTGPLAELEPIKFTFRMQLSKDAQTRREKWLGQNAQDRTASVDEQILDEVADLLIAEPEGIEDWAEPGGDDGAGNVGQRLRQYVAETTDADSLFILKQILEAANTAYWAAITPREFRPAISDSRS